MSHPNLTPKQKRFVEEYLIDLNATQAAIRAGYSAKTADVQGCNLLGNVKVAAFIQQAMAERSERTKITADKVIQELAKLGFSDMRKFASWGAGGVSLKGSDELVEEDAACVAEVSETVTQFGGSVKFKLHDKKGALELIGKHLGIFADKLELSGSLAHTVEKTNEELEAIVAETFTAYLAGVDAATAGGSSGAKPAPANTAKSRRRNRKPV